MTLPEFVIMFFPLMFFALGRHDTYPVLVVVFHISNPHDSSRSICDDNPCGAGLTLESLYRKETLLIQWLSLGGRTHNVSLWDIWTYKWGDGSVLVTPSISHHMCGRSGGGGCDSPSLALPPLPPPPPPKKGGVYFGVWKNKHNYAQGFKKKIWVTPRFVQLGGGHK